MYYKWCARELLSFLDCFVFWCDRKDRLLTNISKGHDDFVIFVTLWKYSLGLLNSENSKNDRFVIEKCDKVKG